MAQGVPREQSGCSHNLQAHFNILIREVAQLLSEKEESYENIASYINSLPPNKIGGHYNYVVRHMVDSTALKDVSQFMAKLSMYMHFTDSRLLKEVAAHFASDFQPDFLRKVEAYEVDIADFCRNTTVASFVYNQQEEISEVPEYFTTLQVKKDIDPNKWTLEDMKQLQKALSQKLGRYLKPQVDECAMIFFKMEPGNAITWLIPLEIEPELMTSMSDAELRKFFASVGIMTVLMGGKCYSEDQTASQESDSNSGDGGELDKTLTPTNQRKSTEKEAQLEVTRVPDPLDIQAGPRSRLVKDFLDENTDLHFVDQDVFFTCFAKIKQWLDLDSIAIYLMKYGVVKNGADMEDLTSSFRKPQDRINSLIRIVEKSGSDGFMFLYMCLRETSEENRGHEDAVTELDHHARENHIHRKSSVASSISNTSGYDNPFLSTGEYNPISERIELLEKHFCSLVSSILEELIEKQVDVKQIKNNIMALPFRLSRDVAYVVGENAPDIRRKVDLDRLFVYLNATIWNFIDFSLLEHIIRQFGSIQLRREMERYVADMALFSKQTTVSQLVKNWPGRKETPPTYCNLTIKIKEDPNKCTLEQLSTLRRELYRQFLPPLSELALLLCSCSSGSVVVKWFLPIKLVPALMVEVRKPEFASFSESNSIESVQIRGVPVYTNQSYISSGSEQVLEDVKKLSLNFEPGHCHMGSNGQYPSICMDSQGWIIQVYHRETIINFRLRYKIGYLCNGKITWSGKSTSYNRGFYPRIAMNDSGVVLTVFTAQVGRQIFYRLGKLKYDQDGEPVDEVESQSPSIPDEDTINGATIEWLGERELFGEGRNPDVTISNNNTVIIVYEKGGIRIRTKYRIGDVQGKSIIWRSDPASDQRLVRLGTSKHASISVNDKGEVVIGYSSGIERAVHFVAGHISSNNSSSIILGDAKFSPPGANYQPMVSLNNRGHVAAVHHTLLGRLFLRINYGLMMPDPIAGQTSIEWSLAESTNFARDGYHGSVAISDSKNVVTAYKSLTLYISTSIRNKTGKLADK